MVYIAIIVAIFVLDFFVKRWIDKKREPKEESPLLGGRIIIRKYYNQGAVLNFMSKWPKLVKSMCIVMMLILITVFSLLLSEKGNRGLKIGLAMIIGGGMNNLSDRMVKGHVVDYFSFKSCFPKIQQIIFNISDIFIFIGAAWVILFQRK